MGWPATVSRASSSADVIEAWVNRRDEPRRVMTCSIGEPSPASGAEPATDSGPDTRSAGALAELRKEAAAEPSDSAVAWCADTMAGYSTSWCDRGCVG